MKKEKDCLIYITIVNLILFLYFIIYGIVTKYKYFYVLSYEYAIIFLIIAALPVTIPVILLLMRKNDRSVNILRTLIVIIIIPLISIKYFDKANNFITSLFVQSYTEDVNNYMKFDLNVDDVNLNFVSIFPEKINSNMHNIEYRYAYNEYFKKNIFLVILEYTTTKDEFEKEMERVSSLEWYTDKVVLDYEIIYSSSNASVRFYIDENRIRYGYINIPEYIYYRRLNWWGFYDYKWNKK